jgi:hypothetical protein
MTEQTPSPFISEDEWQTKATLAAIEAARRVVNREGVNSQAMISSLSDIEWGWIVCAAIFGWISCKAKQAVAEGRGYEGPIHTMTHRAPAPWEAGAVEAILPALGSIEGIDWSKPVGDWSKDQIVSFSWQIYRMTDAALAARDEGKTDNRFNRERAERMNSARNGGPLLSRDETLNPFI